MPRTIILDSSALQGGAAFAFLRARALAFVKEQGGRRAQIKVYRCFYGGQRALLTHLSDRDVGLRRLGVTFQRKVALFAGGAR